MYKKEELEKMGIKENEVITFKSDVNYFYNCMENKKLSTIRELSKNDERLEKLISWEQYPNNPLYIQFINKMNNEEYFIRRVIGLKRGKSLNVISFSKDIIKLEEE